GPFRTWSVFHRWKKQYPAIGLLTQPGRPGQFSRASQTLATSPDRQQSAWRLMDIPITGSRPTTCRLALGRSPRAPPWLPCNSWSRSSRRRHVHYRGRNSAPGYHCCGKDLVNGRDVYCLNMGGTVIEQAVANAFLEAITPAAIEAIRLSVEQLQATTTPLYRN